MKTPTITVSIAIALAVLAPATASADDVIVVPFSGDLGPELAAATVEVLKLSAGTKPQLAQAPREDILTLAECPDGASVCIGQLAATLDIDRAVTGVVTSGERVDIELQIVFRDGRVETHGLAIETTDPALVVSRYRAALARQLGLVKPTPAVDSLPPRHDPDKYAPVPLIADEVEEPTAAAAPAPARTVRADRGDSRLGKVQTGTWAMFGVGAIGLTLGTAFLIKAGDTEDQILSAPIETSEDLQTLRELEDRGDSEKTTGAVMLIIGGAAAIAGGVMVARDLASDDGGTSLAVGPAGPGGRGVELSVRGSF